jgi:signal transduction histidine kinase
MPASAITFTALGPVTALATFRSVGAELFLAAVPLVPLPVLGLTLTLLVTGIVAFALNPRDDLVRVFSLLLLTCALGVGVNPLFQHGNIWATAIEGGADGLGTALFVQFCLAFPKRHQAKPLPVPWLGIARRAGLLVPLATALAFVLGAVSGGILLSLGRILLSLGFMFGVLLGLAILGHIFVHNPSAEVRGPILVVWLACALAFLPLVVLNSLPYLFAQPGLMPFAQTSYALLALPLAVGFASIRWRKVGLLALIDRVSVNGLLGLALLAGYVAIAIVFIQIGGLRLISWTGLLPLALVVIGATTYAPLRTGIGRFVDAWLYRDHYELGATVQRFSRSLATLRDRDAVAQSLLDDLTETLNLSGAALVFLPGGLEVAALQLIEPGDFFTRGAYGNPAMLRSLAHHLAGLDAAALGLSHQRPLALDPWPDCAALVVVGTGADGEGIALLILGPKRSGGHLRSADRALLATIAHQAATALENAALVGGLQTTLAQLRQFNNQLELARAEQQLLLHEIVQSDERQRAALARELHDDALQDLMYVSRHSRYCASILADAIAHGLVTTPGGHRLHDELEQLAQAAAVSERKLRDLCAGLYPALLESLGLLAAIESLAEEPSVGLSVRVACEPGVEQLAARFDAATRLHIYRIVQEALRNASRHADAEHAEVRIAAVYPSRRVTNGARTPALPSRLSMTIADDGDGMHLPIDYVRLLREGHLGLASMRERADRIGAALTMALNPGGGTRITLIIPLPADTVQSEGDTAATSHPRATPPLPVHVAPVQPADDAKTAHLAADGSPGRRHPHT